MEEEERCSVCLGRPLPDGGKCICDGVGTIHGELHGFRVRVLSLEDELYAVTRQRDNYQAKLVRRTL